MPYRADDVKMGMLQQRAGNLSPSMVPSVLKMSNQVVANAASDRILFTRGPRNQWSVDLQRPGGPATQPTIMSSVQKAKLGKNKGLI